MRRMMVLAAAFAATVSWSKQPSIVGGVPNEAGGEVVFMTDACRDDPGRRVVYAKDRYGKIVVTGCWRYTEGKFFVFWSDGSVYEYPFEALRMTEEFRLYLEAATAKDDGVGT